VVWRPLSPILSSGATEANQRAAHRESKPPQPMCEDMTQQQMDEGIAFLCHQEATRTKKITLRDAYRMLREHPKLGLAHVHDKTLYRYIVSVYRKRR
jgi:hypothetical protein